MENKEQNLESLVEDAKNELDELEDALAKKTGKLRTNVRAGGRVPPPVAQPLYGVVPSEI